METKDSAYPTIKVVATVYLGGKMWEILSEEELPQAKLDALGTEVANGSLTVGPKARVRELGMD